MVEEINMKLNKNIYYKEIKERYPLCINCSELKQQECAEFCGNYWKSIGATEQKAIDDELCRSGRLINADINGSYNIMRKEVGDVSLPADRGFVFNPIKISFN